MNNKMRGFFEPVTGLAIFLIFSSIAILSTVNHSLDNIEENAQSRQHQYETFVTQNTETVNEE